MKTSMILLAILCEVAVVGCGGKLPETRFYQLSGEMNAQPAQGDTTLVLETLSTDPGYDDDRIVYRSNPYRLDYYQYHRWSAAPGAMVGNYLERAFESSGRFRSVVRDQSPNAPAVLGGRVIAIEEVDTSKTSWSGRIVIELTLTDTRTGSVLWTEQFDESEPLGAQTPEGLTKALSAAMARIAAKAAPVVAELADRQAKLNAAN
jgi:ABC-type uncharacterized transport system auxiliary subunit